MQNKQVREDKSGKFVSPMDVVRWCQSHTAYFLVSQGIWLGMITSGARDDGWTASGIANALKELKLSGNGYPSGKQLDCPIWNGDKIRYINLIPDFTIPTLKLDLVATDEDNYVDVVSTINRQVFQYL